MPDHDQDKRRIQNAPGLEGNASAGGYACKISRFASQMEGQVVKVEKVVLEGRRVRLEPLSQGHLAGLAEAIEDGRLWERPVTFVPHPKDLRQFLEAAQSAHNSGKELAFATLDALSGRVLGSTRFRCIEATHRRVEIGFTFLSASNQRTHVNTEAKYLMLCHAFEVWGCNRVELLTDERNSKSRSAILRMGAREEGILRSHMVMRDGHVRNSVLYSVVAAEWPQAKVALEAKLRAAHPPAFEHPNPPAP